MGLFGKKESLNNKSKVQIYLEDRGVNNLSEDSFIQVEKIISDLSGNGLIKTGMALSFAKAEEQAKISYLSALVEQNWVLISQNQQIIDELKKLNSK